MKKYFVGFYYSLPIQLLLLHLRKYQVLLIFWYILFATVAGSFLNAFGSYALFLAPEYLGEVNAVSVSIVGFSFAIFVMSWNITTFILFSREIKFLSTTTQPFLKYCINNAILPLIFLFFYLFRAVYFARYQELLPTSQIFFLILGFIIGFFISVSIAFLYFFGADKSIYKGFAVTMQDEHKRYARKKNKLGFIWEEGLLKVQWYFSATFKLRQPRNIKHYNEEFIDSIFKRHHLAAIFSIFIAFVFLIGIGYLLDNKYFQIPAAASITLLLAILIATVGAISIFLRRWSVPVIILIYVLLNFLYQEGYIDLRNRAYGLNYDNKEQRGSYSQEYLKEMCSDSLIEKDKAVFIERLNNWKAKQNEEKPVFYILNTSGGGSRSASFTLNVLQHLDSLMQGELMNKIFLISGASGGMLGAAYYRELYLKKQTDNSINLFHKKYVDNISKDLLNPLFSSLIARDLIAPVQKFNSGNFKYIKDRGYAFEQKLIENSEGLFNKKIKDYFIDEQQAKIPTIFFNSVITRDARKLIISSHSSRFLMKSYNKRNNISMKDPDAIDFMTLFKNQNAEDLRITSALRMNATFPYVLPNVWLPSNPVIDVMDAGLRDNFGQEIALRFIEVFKDWLLTNCSKIVIIQIRDRKLGDWDKPYETKNLSSILTKPLLILQNNWHKFQDYYQNDQISFLEESLNGKLFRYSFQYLPVRSNVPASLNFHLTTAEKKDIAEAVFNKTNQATVKDFMRNYNKK